MTKPHPSDTPCVRCGAPYRAPGACFCQKCATGRVLSESEVLQEGLGKLTTALNNIAAAIREPSQGSNPK